MQNTYQFLQKRFNKENEIWEITKKGIQGEINWEEGLKRRVDRYSKD